MTEWAAKRFWTKSEVVGNGTSFQVALDGRQVRTPLKSPLEVPTRALAEAIAAEWAAQGEKIDPLSMPVTRSANAAIDKVIPQHGEVTDMLAAYAETDLLCYRAGAPQELVDRQTAGWAPLLHWAAEDLGAPLVVTMGVLPIPQPAESLERYRDLVGAFDPFAMTALHDLVTLSGSLVLALAVARGRIAADEGWNLSRIDELWQAEHWGDDDEALEMAQRKAAAFLHAKRFMELSDAS